MAATASTPVELVEQVYARLPARAALGPRALRAPAHARREDPREPPARSRGRRSARSSGAEATPTSIPTASRCRTRSRRS